jgi:signal transduction histidine kinase
MCVVKNSHGGPDLTVGMLAHELLNRLSIIIGNCDLVSERTQADSESARLLSLIRESARSMAVDLSSHPCEPTELHTARIEKEQILLEGRTTCQAKINNSNSNSRKRARRKPTDKNQGL